ncbi:MAG: lectin-like protein [Eubacteriales bacterium]|nr:lectin-like protein [Eubacteriales bacterium]
MKKAQFDPERAVGRDIIEFDRQQLCDFIAKLCETVKADAGAGVYRGGIFPENISIDDSGAIALGPAAADDWKGQELQFLPPELYWNGRRTPASDVYSIGLIMHYALTGGKLPFDGTCRDPQLRRMTGEAFEVPKEAGRRLGEIIGKATQFRPENRYQSMDEMRVMAESCLKNLYLNGAPSAEKLFSKSDDDLTEIEKLMVGIIEKEEDTPIPVEKLPSSPQDRLFETEETDEETVGENADDGIDEEEIGNRIQELFAREENELDPVIINNKGKVTPVVQYTKNAERERQSTEEVSRRKRRPVAIILVLCAILVIASLLFNALIKDMAEDTETTRKAALALEMERSRAADEEEPAASAVNPTPKIIDDEDVLDIPPDPSPSPEAETDSETPAVMTETPPETEPAPAEHGYELFIEDVSWEQAKAACESMGGHLAVINDADEFAAVTQLAQQYGIEKVWIGGHRVNGAMVWEDGSTQVYEKWGYGEPSFFDGPVAEDYVLLWNNRGWVFNDSRNDPCKDYPNMYSGQLAYICEFGDQ